MTLPANPPAGASAAQIARARFGRPTTVKLSDVAVGTSVISLCLNNPKRLQLSLTNWGTAPVSFSTNPAVGTQSGNPLQPNGGNAILHVIEDGEPVAWQYFAISTAASQNVHVEETEAV
jgi:hypothetical protein